MSSDAAAVAVAASARKDGRQALQMRGRELRLSELHAADGSCWYAQGSTAVLVAVYGPTLAKVEVYDTCVVHVRVSHVDGAGVPLAGGGERVARAERIHERATVVDADALQSTLEHVVRGVVALERYPRCVLGVDVVVVHDDGSLLAVAVNAVMCALLDAGVPCRTTMAAVCIAALPAPTTTAATKSTDRNNNNKTASSSSCDRVYVIDPTHHEEQCPQTASGGYATHDDNDNSSALSSSSSTTAAHALCTVILANPASGGGVLASRVHSTHTSRHADDDDDTSKRVAKSHKRRSRDDDDDADAATTTASATTAARHTSCGGGLRVDELAHMLALAERAAPLLFDFFRQCNVPLE